MSAQDSDSSAANSGIVEDKALDKDAIIDLLGEEDADKEETIDLAGEKKSEKTLKAGSEGDTEQTIEDELEEELEEKEIDEEKLDLVASPSRKEILTKYPTLFKDFPHLERAFYREQKYSELLPTIEDAKIAAEKSELLDSYEQEILTGSTESLLSAVRDGDKAAFAKVVDNYLPTLYKVDEGAYYHTIGNVIKHTIISMVKDGKEQANEDLSGAAAVLNQYIFGTTNFTHPQRLSKDEVANPELQNKEQEIDEKEKAFLQKQYNTVSEDLSTRVDNVLKASVDKAIDPHESMTEYVKKNATREVLQGLEEVLERDTRFKAIYDKLWERAFENDFDRESMDKIKSAYLSKAKTVLPDLIRKARNEALRGTKGSTGRDTKGPLPVGKIRSSATTNSGRANSGSKQIPKGMSTLDFLNSD
jgi:hypothetical protein